MTRRNLCTNPAAGVATTGWSGTSAPVQATGLTGFPVTTGMKATATGYFQTPTATCAPGDVITVSLYEQGPTVLGSKTVYAAFTRTAGGDDFSQTFTVTCDTTVRRTTFTATAPANATGVYLVFDGVPADTIMTAVMYEPGATSTSYADGDTVGWSWDGTAGLSSSSEAASGDQTAAGTISGTGTLSSSITSVQSAAGTISGTGHLSGVATGGDGPVVVGANYDLNDIMDALAARFEGVATGDTIGGTTITMNAYSEVVGDPAIPAIVLDLDDQTWDLDMDGGADSFQVVALVLVTYQDAENAQRTLRSFLSRKSGSGMMRLKAQLEADQTLGGLVSYAIMTGVRNIGIITYSGMAYMGAELIIEVMS